MNIIFQEALHYPEFGLNLGLNKGSKLHENRLKAKSTYFCKCFKMRAENGTQTRDPQLGRLVLYRLSYFRDLKFVGSDGFEPPKATPVELQSTPFGHSGNCPF